MAKKKAENTRQTRRPVRAVVPLKPRYWWAVVTPSGNLKALNSVKKYAVQHATWSHGRYKKLESLLARGYRVVRVLVSESL